MFDQKERGASRILYPAFVFSYEEFHNPKNRWAHGLKNVFFVRFSEHHEQEDGLPRRHVLKEIEQFEKKLCFPNEHANHVLLDEAIRPPRCFHQSAFTGLFVIRRALVKLLNKCGGSSEEQEITSDTIGLVPTETWTYIVHLCRRQGIKVHSSKTSASYLEVEPNFTRHKVRLQYPSSTIRFQSPEELKFLRSLIGFCSTYGSSERKPTLSDGAAGISLKRKHRLTLVKGTPPDDEAKFRIRSRSQRVDLTWSDFHCRVLVGYEQYNYDIDRQGNLKNPPPTDHLEFVLKGGTNSPDNDDPSTKAQEKPQDKPKHDDTVESDTTFNKILAMTDSDATTVESDDDDCLVVGASFQDHDDQNVYEVKAIQRNKEGEYVISQVIAGMDYDHDLPMNMQEVRKWEDLDEVRLLINDYN